MDIPSRVPILIVFHSLTCVSTALGADLLATLRQQSKTKKKNPNLRFINIYVHAETIKRIICA